MKTFVRKVRRYTVLLTIASFVYSLGSCPCACPEHNQWVVGLSQLVGNHGKRTTVADTAQSPSLLEGECDGEVKTPHIEACAPLNTDTHRLLCFLISDHAMSTHKVIPSNSERPFSRDSRADAIATLPVRADIQVFTL